MKKKTRILQNPYIILGILSLITGLILYSECIFGDNLLAYGDWGFLYKRSLCLV